MTLSPRTGTSNHISLHVRFFAFACIITLLAAQVVLPAKAVVFASGRITTPPPVSAPPETFHVFDAANHLSLVTGLSGIFASVVRFITPNSGDEKTKALAAEVEPSSSAVAPAMFLPSASAFDLAKLRLDPKNATGGTDLYSQNFGWGSSLVGLPGRAGLDMGFGISYNSLVWLKDAAHSEIVFDPDTNKVSPGFTFGFPDIEPAYYDTDKSVWVFLMLNPDGSRTEFRRVGSSEVFDSADSSYRQLVINPGGTPDGKAGSIDMTVTSTDGTKMHYLWKSQVLKYQCEEIKDRNGNYITINYTSGRMTSLSDTLGRVITINYDSGNYPTSITQTWKDGNGGGTNNVTHTWATFSYTNATVSTSFSGLTVIGPANSSTVKVLEKITYPDSSFTKFEYNGYIQVKKISNVAADSTSHVLNYVSTNLDSVSGSQTDCPRLSEQRSWAENFNLVSGTATEVVVTNSLTTGATYSLPNSITGSATRIDVAVTGHPDGLYTRTYVGSSGYKESLPLATEDCTGTSCATRLRWTWTDWTQDNTGVSYITNPRVIESRVGDGTNTKKTTVGYGSNGYGLSELVKVYDTDLSTVLKTQTTAYQLSSTYTGKRIIGLPSETKLFEGTDSSGTLMSKVTYAYDEGNLTGTDPVQNISPTQHDNTNFSSSYVTGRGLLTSMIRWDATAPTTSGSAVSSSMKYNTAGAVVAKTDPLSHTVKIAYADNYNSSPGVSTYAYPTTLTDQAGNSSTAKYRYDIGANVEATSPAPAGQTYGKTSKRLFDSLGRIDTQSIYVYTTLKAYTRNEYPTNGIQSKVYSTIIDTTGSTTGPDTADEVLSESWFDGAGRVRGSRTEHPGSTGGWTASQTEYDILGRVKRQSVPTEVSVASPFDPAHWTPAGDDYRGTGVWLWNSQEYDWKGRTTRTIPSDSSGSDGKDTLISYAGCGCAGGQVTTVQGPVTTAVDVSGTTQTTKRRTQKTYADILGRTAKTEVWDLDGAGSAPYSTVVNTYNGRDQVTNVRQYSGGTSSSTYQDTTMSYDGHGRPYQIHKPEFDSSTYVTTTYNADDSVATVTDPRGAVTANSYNSRGLLTGIAYSVPYGSGITDPSDIGFSYDNLGNRTQMTDGLGTVDYTYDALSRLTKERRTFTDTLANAPISGNKYDLDYTYTMSGGLASIKDPWNNEVTYSTDKVGRTTSIGASNFTGRTTGSTAFASSISYRAFGMVKSMNYSTDDTTSISMTYDTALRPSSYQATSAANAGDIQNRSYSYFNDGSIQKAENDVEAKFTQNNKYDFAGRLKENQFGESGTPMPYKQILDYDAFNNIAGRQTWDESSTQRNFTAGYTNNRKSSGGYQSGTDTFDATGNITLNHFYNGANNDKRWTYDAGGGISEWLESTPIASGHYWDEGEIITFDGDGRSSKRLHRNRNRYTGTEGYVETAGYNIYSSVTGQLITELTDTGAKVKTSVYLGTSAIAEQRGNGVFFKHVDPTTGSSQTTDSDGLIEPYDVGKTEFEPLGAVANPTADEMTTPNYPRGGSTKDPQLGGCVVDRILQSKNVCSELLGKGLASICPYNDCTPKKVYYNGKNVWAFVEATGDGYSGYVPSNARYVGKGVIQQKGESVKGKIRRKDTNIGGINGAENEADLRLDDFSRGIWNDLSTFLNNNPNCRNILYNLAAGGLGVIDPSDRDDPIEILLSTTSVIDLTSRGGGGEEDVAARGLNDPNRIEFYRDWLDYSQAQDSNGRGKIVFHELLHVLLGVHREVVSALNIEHSPYPPIPPRVRSPFAYESDSDSETAQKRHEARVRRTDGSDLIAAVGLSGWLNNDCSNAAK